MVRGQLAGALIASVVQLCPAQTFAAIRGRWPSSIIAVLAFLRIRKELLLPIPYGVFVESLSVMMQVSYFNIPNAADGEGSAHLPDVAHPPPLSYKGIFETKIVIRF